MSPTRFSRLPFLDKVIVGLGVGIVVLAIIELWWRDDVWAPNILIEAASLWVTLFAVEKVLHSEREVRQREFEQERELRRKEETLNRRLRGDGDQRHVAYEKAVHYVDRVRGPVFACIRHMASWDATKQAVAERAQQWSELEQEIYKRCLDHQDDMTNGALERMERLQGYLRELRSFDDRGDELDGKRRLFGLFMIILSTSFNLECLHGHSAPGPADDIDGAEEALRGAWNITRRN